MIAGERDREGGEGRGKERRRERQAGGQMTEDAAKLHPDSVPTGALRSMPSEAIQFGGNLSLPNR